MTPPPPVSAPADHFLITAFTSTCGILQFTFTCTTDVPVRLTLHLTNVKPIIRRIPFQKRGYNFPLSSLTCFDEINTVVQTEPGDTTAHTFTVPLTVYCTIHYWYLTGTHAGQPSASISQVFQVHCYAPQFANFCYNYAGTLYGARSLGGCGRVAYAIKPCQTVTPISISFWLSKIGVWLLTSRAEIWTCNASAMPLVRIAQGPRISIADPGGGVLKYTFPITSPPLVKHGLYSLVYWADFYRIPKQVLGVQVWNTQSPDSCPHPVGANYRTWTMTLGVTNWTWCTAGFAPWIQSSGTPVAYELYAQLT